MNSGNRRVPVLGHNRLRRLARPYLAEIAAIGAELPRRGWAEANAGNLSIRLGPTPGTGSAVSLPECYAGLAGKGILIKRNGVRLRALARTPLAGLCVVRVNRDGSAYQVLPQNARPSSELLTHLAAHETLVQHRPEQTALIHTHPTELIALTNIITSPRRLITLLADTHTESPAVLSRVILTKRLQPGTIALARATANAMKRHDAAIWPGHGIIATGPDLSAALDIIEILNKLATLALFALGCP